MLARELFEQAWHELVDPDHTRWTEPELCIYLTDALAQLAALRPTLFTESVVLPLEVGRVQRLSAEFTDLLDVLANCSVDGTMFADILPGSFDLTRSFGPSPNVQGDEYRVKSYTVHPENNTMYYVDPPCNERGHYVMALLRREAQQVLSGDDLVNIPNTSPRVYRPALLEWVLYRAFSKDSESQSSFERAQKHYTAFLALAGATPKDKAGVPVAAKENLRGAAA